MGYNNKPSSKIDWTPTGTEPSAGKKSTGYAADEKWPHQYANWLHNILSSIQNWLQGSNENWIVIDSDTDEGDYTSLSAYIADSPTAGDNVLMKVDENITSKLTIPSDIKIKMLKGVKITTSTDLAEMIEISDNVELESDFAVELSHTGTIGDAIIVGGDNASVQNIKLSNTSTGTVTNAFNLKAGKDYNLAKGVVVNSGGGTVTNSFVDNSEKINNDIVIRDDINLYKSDGLLGYDLILYSTDTDIAAQINAAGDNKKVLISESITITAEQDITVSNLELVFDRSVSVICATSITSMLKFTGDNIIVRNASLESQEDITNALEFSGNFLVELAYINQNGAGKTLTDLIKINTGYKGFANIRYNEEGGSISSVTGNDADGNSALTII